MAIDPAYRTGCKVAVLNEQGDVLDTFTIYPHAPQERWDEAQEQLLAKIEEHSVEIIAIGNGTASRETEVLAAQVIAACRRNCTI